MKYLIFFVICVLKLTFVVSAPVEKPKIQPDEYVFFLKDKYHVFKIVEYSGLKLSSNCFGNRNKKNKSTQNKPKCQAFEVSKIKVKDLFKEKYGGTNPASLHCSRMMGESLIAYDSLKNEYDYCRFADNSLVSSWSMLDNSYKRPKN